MKANQRFIAQEEAVSPVIAVILMVAITVVLAATVFVLVNDLGKNVGSTGPSLGLVSDAAGSSTSKWTVKVSSATKLADLTDYRFVFATPSDGTIVATATSATFLPSQEMSYQEFTSIETDRKSANTTGGDPTNAVQIGYMFHFVDVDGNGKWSVGDTVEILYDGTTTDETAETTGHEHGVNNYDDAFPSGEYTIEILHIPSGSSSASLPRTF